VVKDEFDRLLGKKLWSPALRAGINAQALNAECYASLAPLKKLPFDISDLASNLLLEPSVNFRN
jgi:hypothetical protein